MIMLPTHKSACARVQRVGEALRRHTCEELHKVIEHVGNPQHHFRQQPGGCDFCRGVFEHLDHDGGTCKVVLHNVSCTHSRMLLE